MHGSFRIHRKLVRLIYLGKNGSKTIKLIFMLNLFEEDEYLIFIGLSISRR